MALSWNNANPLGNDFLGMGWGLGGAQSRGDNEFRSVGSAGDYYDQKAVDRAQRERYGLADQLAGRVAPQAQAVGLGPQSAFAGQQSVLGNMLMDRAAGRGPSIADMQMRQGLDAATAQQQAFAASGRGNPALAQRQAALNASGLAQNMAGQAAMNRVAEQQGAQGLLGQFLQGARGQDEQRAQTAAQMAQQNNQFNTSAQMNQTSMNDQARMEALRQQLEALGMRNQGMQAYQGARTSRFNALSGVPTGGEQMIGALSSLAGAIATRGK